MNTNPIFYIFIAGWIGLWVASVVYDNVWLFVAGILCIGGANILGGENFSRELKQLNDYYRSQDR